MGGLESIMDFSLGALQVGNVFIGIFVIRLHMMLRMLPVLMVVVRRLHDCELVLFFIGEVIVDMRRLYIVRGFVVVMMDMGDVWKMRDSM